MVVIISRSLKICKNLAISENKQSLSQFNDSSQVSDYASESMATLVNEKIITGNGDILNPLGNASRAETAVIMYRVYNKYSSVTEEQAMPTPIKGLATK